MYSLLLRFSRLTDVINLQNHPNHLCGKRDLLLFADQSFYDMLILHIWKTKHSNQWSKSTQRLINRQLQPGSAQQSLGNMATVVHKSALSVTGEAKGELRAQAGK